MNFSVGHVDSKIIPESVKRHMIQSLSHKNKGGKKGKSFSFLSFPFSDSLSFPVLFFSLESYILLKDLSVYEIIFSEKSAY